MIGGEVTKTASPRLALALIPSLTSGIMALLAVLAIAAPPEKRWAIVPAQLFLGLILTASNSYMLSRAARR